MKLGWRPRKNRVIPLVPSRPSREQRPVFQNICRPVTKQTRHFLAYQEKIWEGDVSRPSCFLGNRLNPSARGQIAETECQVGPRIVKLQGALLLPVISRVVDIGSRFLMKQTWWIFTRPRLFPFRRGEEERERLASSRSLVSGFKGDSWNWTPNLRLFSRRTGRNLCVFRFTTLCFLLG